MTPPRTLGLVLISMLAACDLDKGSEDESSADESESSSEGESSDETTESGATETSSDGPEDSEGPATPEDFAAVCEQQTERGACEAVPTEYYPVQDQTTWCTWWIEVPVELVEDACSFGEAQARCQMISASESGCGGLGNACQSTDAGWSRVEGESIVIGRGELCGDLETPCDVDAEGVVISGAPECACLCDAAFPS